MYVGHLRKIQGFAGYLVFRDPGCILLWDIPGWFWYSQDTKYSGIWGIATCIAIYGISWDDPKIPGIIKYSGVWNVGTYTWDILEWSQDSQDTKHSRIWDLTSYTCMWDIPGLSQDSWDTKYMYSRICVYLPTCVYVERPSWDDPKIPGILMVQGSWV